MKTISCLLVVIGMFLSRVNAGAVHSASIDPRVLKAFSLAFPSATNAKWYEDANGYTVAFSSPQISGVAIYNKEGELVKVRRSYSKELLALPIQISVKKNYPDKLISGITEVTTEDGIIYEITLKDQDHWYKLLSDDHGRLEMVQKFRRAE